MLKKTKMYYGMYTLKIANAATEDQTCVIKVNRTKNNSYQ